MRIFLNWLQHCCSWGLGTVLLCVAVPTSADYVITDLDVNIRPYDISNNGIIAGSHANPLPFVGIIGTLGGLQPISTSALESRVNAVNSSGLSVGYSYIDSVQQRAFLRVNGSTLNSFEAIAIDASDVSEFDHIAGTSLFNGLRLGFVYNPQNKSLLALPTFGGAEGRANGINNRGSVVGAAQDASGAFIGFTAAYGANNIVNLGTLAGFANSEASAVNDLSHVVGWAFNEPASASSKRAFVWVPVAGATGIQDLGSLGVDVGSVANDINNNGYVVGHSIAADGSTRAFFHDRKATDVMAIAGNSTHIYLGTSNGVYRSGDGGLTIAARSNGLTELRVTALATTSEPLIVYAGTAAGAFRTVDGGANWTAVNNGLTYTDNTVSPAVESVQAITTLAVTGSGTAEILAGTRIGVYRTTDGGGAWSLATSLSSSAVVINEIRSIAGSPLAYAATNNGIYFSNNGGSTWANIQGSGLPTSPVITAVDVAYTVPFAITAVYAGTSTGIFKTVDSTAASPPWTDASGTGATGLPAARNIRRLKFHAATNTLYAALAGVGIYKITEGDVNWKEVTKDGLTNLDALAFTATLAAQPTLYVGTLSGMFRFTDTVPPTNTPWTPTNNMQDLNALIPATGWALHNATAINNAGQIVGWGDLNGVSHGFLLTPTSGILTAQLTVVKSLPPPPYQQFVPVNYTITVTNNGPATATGILLTDWLPRDVVLRATQGAQCTNIDSVTLTCRLENLEPGKSHKITIIVSPTAPNVSLNNIARVVANESDPAFSDNTSAVEAKADKCFIATAAYGSFLDPHVQTLRHFRDEYLLTNAAGRTFVQWYYRASPPLAASIAQHDSARVMTRLLLTPVVYAVKYPVMALVMMVLVVVGVSRWRRSRAVVMQGV